MRILGLCAVEDGDAKTFIKQEQVMHIISPEDSVTHYDGDAFWFKGCIGTYDYKRNSAIR
jgi:hypothetical protein